MNTSAVEAGACRATPLESNLITSSYVRNMSHTDVVHPTSAPLLPILDAAESECLDVAARHIVLAMASFSWCHKSGLLPGLSF